MQNLQYPIGPFIAPNTASQEDRNNWIESIETLPDRIEHAINNWSDEQLDTPYRPGGWTVKKLIHHIADSHMNSLIRFKLGLTETNPTIKPYLQDKWSELSDSTHLSPDVSLALLKSLHQRLTTLLKHMDDNDFEKTIYHPEMQKTMTLEKLLAMYAWHSNHHLAHITNLKAHKGW